MAACCLFQAGFIDLIVHYQNIVQMRSCNSSFKIAKTSKARYLREVAVPGEGLRSICASYLHRDIFTTLCLQRFQGVSLSYFCVKKG